MSLDAILAGKEKVPLQGARFDLKVDGRCERSSIWTQHGVGYNSNARRWPSRSGPPLAIETDDGHRIALSGDGQAAARNGEPMPDIFANIRLSTRLKEFAWVIERQI